MSPKKEEMTKFAQMKLHSLPRDTEVWTKDQQMSSKKLDKFFFLWRECTGILPVRQFLPSDGRRVEELSASFSCCVYSRNCAAAKYTHVYRTS